MAQNDVQWPNINSVLHYYCPCPAESSFSIAVGDVILGLASSGFHSNGFSLVRKVVESAGLDFTASCPWQVENTLGRPRY